MDFQLAKDTLRAEAKLMSLADTQKKQQLKAQEAAEYRARILKQQPPKSSVEMSPAYGREKASLKRAKKKKTEKKLESLEGKATSAQCAFNLANILMVR